MPSPPVSTYTPAMVELSRQIPGHFTEATAASWLLLIARADDAQTEMERVLPAVLNGSGPRWLGAAASLAFVAARTGDGSAAERLWHVLSPYRGRLVVLGGANTCMGPVSYFLGLLAARLRRLDEAADCLAEATPISERIGALPGLVLCLDARADVLGLRQAPGDRQQSAAPSGRAPRSR